MPLRLWLRSWYRKALGKPIKSRRSRRGQQPGFRPLIEALEDRLTPTTYTVNLTTDTAPTTGGVSTGSTSGDLRYCIAQVNADNTTNADTIQFDQTVFNGSQGHIMLGGSVLEVSRTTGSVTIDGLSGGAQGVAIDGNGASGVFQIDAGATVTLNGLTIENGGNSVTGGGINSNGVLTLTNCVMSGNTAIVGGAIANAGTLTVVGSTLSSNLALAPHGFVDAFGGAIRNQGTMTLTDSTLSGNSARDANGSFAIGGAIDNTGSMFVTNCTFANNSADFGGGVGDEVGTAFFTNCTLTNNFAGQGSGIANYATLTLNNSIVAGNFVKGNAAVADDIYGAVTGSNNLIGGDSTSGLTDGVNGNIILTAGQSAGLDPYGLAANGSTGPKTIALLPNSPALNSGNNALAVDAQGNPLTTDERGNSYSRIFAGTVDIGAFESEGPPAPPTDVTAAPGNGVVVVTWTASPGATSYNVYRSTTEGVLGPLYQTGIVGTTFNDTGVDNGTTYYYQVSAVNPAGESAPSEDPTAQYSDPSAAYSSTFNGPAATLNAQWQMVLGGGFSINSSDQAVSAPLIEGLFKAATINDLSLANVSISADVGLNPTPANGVSAVAVIVRSQDANDVNNCYFAALTPSPDGLDQILIEKVINGQIFGVAAKALPAGTTSGTLTLDVYGNTLAAYLNGQLEVIGTDSTFTAAGQVGIGSQDAGATFANVVVRKLQTPVVPFGDSFTRSASATLGNPWYVNYVVPPNSSTAPGGGFGINGSEQAVSLGAGANVATLFGINLSSTTVSATVVNAGSGAGVVADWNNATQSGYGLLLSGSTLQLYKVINGSPMPLGSGHAVGASSGLVGLQVSGGTLSVYFNSGFVFSLNDSTFTSGSAGLAASGAEATFSGFTVSGS